MVSFKKLFISTSLLLNGIAAFPTQTGTLKIAATEVRAVHILCGNEETDAKTAMQAAIGADSVTIGAQTREKYLEAKKGIDAVKPNFTFNKVVIYGAEIKVTDTTAITLSSVTGATTLTEGTGPRICRQSQ
ncbi:uncharacterized protein EAE98_011403 [Botrytis deweyae]|uniref:Uncharacterized protein n=1 Tax=Botrytis deweyae TaxID=2478750 RepID=A0ABQ7I5R2_9HELO|nr:uncharacterized protein EAE98_011403 [Botrytis deweyae]KAF7914704.1 hypothetical protein EAE98_011403 [Botrytis deweyae]